MIENNLKDVVQSRNFTVSKPLTLYTYNTQHHLMGKLNKIVKLTDKKIRYILSIKRIVPDMKISEIGDETDEKNGF